jgi:major vault protein
VLGEKTPEGRAGRAFNENGMVVYDVEVLEVSILDEQVQVLLADAQRSAITSEVGRKKEELRLLDEQAREAVNRAVHASQRETLVAELDLEAARQALAEAKAQTTAETARLQALGRARAEAEALEVSSLAETAAAGRKAELAAKELSGRVAAFQAQMGALQPELIATLKSLGNQQLAASLTEHLAPLAILGGESVAEVAGRLLAALPSGPDGGDLAAKVIKAKKSA